MDFGNKTQISELYHVAHIKVFVYSFIFLEPEPIENG